MPWGALSGTIETSYKAFSELDLEVMVQHAEFGGGRIRSETFSQFIGRVAPEFRELDAFLRVALPPELFGAPLKK